jgi:hypothetical protein
MDAINIIKRLDIGGACSLFKILEREILFLWMYSLIYDFENLHRTPVYTYLRVVYVYLFIYIN